MKLKNDALQELYDTLVSAGVSMSPYADSPVYKAFRECDEKLSGSAAFAHIKALEDRCENLERSNKALRDDNDKLGDKAIELAKKNERLEKDLDICKCSNDMLLAGSMESISEKRKLENEIDAKSKENAALVSANANLSDRNAKLQRNFDCIDHLLTIQIQENRELRSKITNMQRENKNYETIAKEREDLVKERDEAKQDRDAWQRRAKYAEKELDLAKRNKDGWRSRALEAEKRYATLQKENTDLSKKVVDFEKRIAELQKKGDDLTKKGEDLKKRLNSVYGTVTCGPEYFYKDGMYDLWNMLQEVSYATLSERLGYFQNVCSVEDLLEWDLEDFLEEYNEWQDLLNTVPGIKPKEEEHQLDYGDAVRVPWKSYDYMYIGPEGKHIRLFDPKTHTVVVVSVTNNLTYQGYKIILCDEDDIRKIWKDKK